MKITCQNIPVQVYPKSKVVENTTFKGQILLFQKSGIDQIFPGMKIDDYLFHPCGYSMNGILQNEAIDNGLVRGKHFWAGAVV